MTSIYTVGSINMDLVVFCERMPIPGETILGTSFEQHPGGKGANQAVAAARAGIVSMMVGAVGKDSFGQKMCDKLVDCGVDIRHIETVDGSTGVALITVSKGENQIVVVPAANSHINAARVRALEMKPGDVCLAQLEINLEVVKTAFERARSLQSLTLFNPAPAIIEARALFPLADVLVVNETECNFYTKTIFDLAASEDSIRKVSKSLGLRSEQALIVTLGASGAVALFRDHVLAISGHTVDAVDTTGAGDCFCGYLAAALASGENIESAIREANASAALSVQSKGATLSIPARKQVKYFLGKLGVAE